MPCLIRRAALLGDDPTSYGVPNLRAGTLDTTQAEGQQVRSFQVAINRVAKRSNLAKILIHKPGSLADFSNRWDAYADVYKRGLEEVGKLLVGVKTTPL